MTSTVPGSLHSFDGIHDVAPYFSICIPQHDRTDFLLRVCASFAEQTFRDFEVCISDDCSPDGRQAEIVEFLERNGLSHRFVTQDRNLRYDGNLRASMALARGRYCLLMGNDDCLAAPDTLQELHDEIVAAGEPAVIVTNFEDFTSGAITRRIPQTGILGSGPRLAAGFFRNFAFVSGVLLSREEAQREATDRWDGSEMYQMYIGCRLIAAGGAVMGVERSVVRKDVRIPGIAVDSYARRPRLKPCPIEERKLTLAQLGHVVTDAVAPYLPARERGWVAERVLFQIFVFTYPFWLLEYRRVQSWKYAVGVGLGMRPRNTLPAVELGRARRFRLRVVYALASAAGLLAPDRLFGALRPILYRIAKSYRSRDARHALAMGAGASR
jgi:hypothetical protein